MWWHLRDRLSSGLRRPSEPRSIASVYANRHVDVSPEPLPRKIRSLVLSWQHIQWVLGWNLELLKSVAANCNVAKATGPMG